MRLNNKSINLVWHKLQILVASVSHASLMKAWLCNLYLNVASVQWHNTSCGLPISSPVANINTVFPRRARGAARSSLSGLANVLLGPRRKWRRPTTIAYIYTCQHVTLTWGLFVCLHKPCTVLKGRPHCVTYELVLYWVCTHMVIVGLYHVVCTHSRN